MKALYAKLIGFGAQTAYELSDGLVTMQVNMNANLIPSIDPRIKLLKDFGKNNLVVTLPRWGAFTEIIPKLAEAKIEFVNKSGNDDILVTVITDKKTNEDINDGKYLFSSLVISPANKKRLAYSVKVGKLPQFINALKQQGMSLEHFYDY